MENMEKKYNGAFSLARQKVGSYNDIIMYCNIDNKTYHINYNNENYFINNFNTGENKVIIKNKSLEKVIDKMMVYLLR